MTNNIDKILIRILQGKASVEENKVFENWLKEDESNVKVFHSLQHYWHHQKSSDQEFNLSKNEIWSTRRNKHKEKRRKLDWKPLQAAAAILFIMLSVGYFLKDAIFTATPEPPKEQAITMIYKTAAAGAKLETILPDGSLVKLNSESSLQYSSNFNDSIREVYLDGEAYFEVTHNPAKPFTVISKDVQTTVLGTSFVISAYQDVASVKVALASGKVETRSLHAENQSINFLAPGEYIDYQQDKIKKGLFEQKEVFGWKDGLLFFKNNNYSQAIAKLERWFGVEIILEGQRPHWKLNGEYQNANLESILAAISYSQGIEYEFLNDKLIRIKSK